MALLHAHVRRHAAGRPDAEAVTDGAARLSYRALDAESDRVARCLRAHGVSRDDLVLLSMRRSVRYLAAAVGVLKAGAACVPLEARTPAARRAQVVRDCRPRAPICDADAAAGLAEDEELRRAGVPLLVVEPAPGGGTESRLRTAEGGAAPEADLPDADGGEDDLACLFYTSGSTGSPKGVMLSHRNVDEYVRWAVERIGIGPADRVLGTAPFYFDMSLFDVWGAFRAGAALCVATEPVLRFPKTLLEFAEREAVTVWKGVSSLLAYVSRAGALSPERLPSLRTVLFGGEPLPTGVLIEWMRTFPDKVFYNAYGPTEATGVSLCYRVPRVPESPAERIPIGIPRGHTDLLLLDDDRRPVPDGEVGEIALGGPCIARGYWNDPEKTRRAFVDDPVKPGRRIYLTGDFARRRPDGNYEFAGRRDDQVKSMGYRLELADVESALTAIDGVHEAGVLLGAPRGAGFDELVGYVVLRGDRRVADVQAAVRARLPFYMVPRYLYEVDRLPRCERGKLDRRALEAHHRARIGAG